MTTPETAAQSEPRHAGSRPAGGATDSRWERSGWLVAAAIAVTPVLAALWSLHDRRWLLTGDWASIDLRVREVGTADTPLIGAYSTRGWAHPGPVIYWIAAPMQWLVRGDPRGLLLTAALINIAAIVGIAWLLRRRQGSGMAIAAMAAVAVLIYGLRPYRVADIWNPLLPLFPLLLVTFLAWSAATGHRRHAVGAIVIGALVAQAHVGLIPVLVVIGAWAVGWSLLGARVERPGPAPDGPGSSAPGHDSGIGWPRVLLVGVLGALAAWMPPVIDQLAGTGNLRRVFDYFTSGATRPVGLARGAGLVGRFVRPDGLWTGDAGPTFSMAGSSPAFVLLMAGLLAVFTVMLWRRGDRVTSAGTSLALVLVLAAVPIASRLDEPVFDYLVRWIEVIGALGWFWVAWGAWCLVRGRVPAQVARRAPTAGLVAVALIAVLAIPGASDFKLPGENEVAAVQAIRHRLELKISKGTPIRIEHRGDSLGNVTSGIIYWLIRDGYRVVTTDGGEGLKYGPDATWEPGNEPPERVYTVTVDYPFSLRRAGEECAKDPGVRSVVRYTELNSRERAIRERLTQKSFFVPGSLTAAEQRLAARLGGHDFRVAVYVGTHVCASFG